MKADGLDAFSYNLIKSIYRKKVMIKPKLANYII